MVIRQRKVQQTDIELIGRAIAGEHAAFDALLFRYRGLVLREAYALVGDWERAEDVAQQTFIQAFIYLRGLREPEN